MFAAGLVLSNLALPEHFGTISLLILNASLLSIVTGLGTDSIVLHKVSNGKWKGLKTVQFSWYAIIIQLILFFALEFSSLVFWNRTLLSNESSAYLFIDLIYFTGLVLTEKYLTLLYSFQNSRLANVSLAIVGFVYFLTLLLIYYFVDIDFSTVFYFFALQSFFQGIAFVALFHFMNKVFDKIKLGKKEFFSAIRFSSLVMVTNVIQLMAYRLDFWVLKYYYSNYEVGIYAQANKFANLTWIVPNILAQLLITRFSAADKADVPKIFSAAFYLNLIGIFATVICANIFYFLYLNQEYLAGLQTFYLMLPGYFFWATVIYIGAYFSWAGKFSHNLFCSSICFVVILLADLILIPKYGMEGAAWANTISYTLVFLVYIFILVKQFSFKWNDLLLLRKKDLFRIVKFVNG
jgi:O-antigen/teichoic acid export membrane protein